MLHQILRVPFQRENTLACVDSLCKAINEFIDGHKLDRSKIMNVCVSLAGRVNSETGFSYSFFKFGDTSLRDLLIERIGLPVEVENDSRVMAYGEYMRGDFKDVKNLIYINAGWGLGMAIIIDGKLYRGMSGFPENSATITATTTSRFVIAARRAASKRRFPARLCTGNSSSV